MLKKPTSIEMDGIDFLNSILEKSTALSSRIDDQLNILLGLGIAVFIFATSKMSSAENYYWIILAICSGLSVVVELFAIHPPKFMAKRGQNESLIYNKNITEKFSDSRAYAQELLKSMETYEGIVGQYAMEIYNVYKFYYGPKRMLFKISRFLLIAGMVLSFILFLLGHPFIA